MVSCPVKPACWNGIMPPHKHQSPSAANGRKKVAQNNYWKLKWADFCRRCTLHGIYEFHESSNWLGKFFWALAFLGATAAAVYGCSKIVLAYLKSPVTVEYFVQDAIYGLQVPDIVICPFNRLNATYVKEHEIPANLTDYIQWAFGLGSNIFETGHHDQLINSKQMANDLQKLLRKLNRLCFISIFQSIKRFRKKVLVLSVLTLS